MGKFFRQRLLILDREGVMNLLDTYDKETKAIKNEILKMCWYMRGGITYDQGMDLSMTERIMIGKIIEDNMETTKKSGLPFF